MDGDAQESAWASPTGGVPWLRVRRPRRRRRIRGRWRRRHATRGVRAAERPGLRAGGDPRAQLPRIWLPIPPETAGGRTSAGRCRLGAWTWAGRQHVDQEQRARRPELPPGSDGGRSAGNAGGSGSSLDRPLGGSGAGAPPPTRSCSAGARHGAKSTRGNPSDTSRMAADTPLSSPTASGERDTSHASPRSEELVIFLPRCASSHSTSPGRMVPGAALLSSPTAGGSVTPPTPARCAANSGPPPYALHRDAQPPQQDGTCQAPWDRSPQPAGA